jgi:DNA-damage-inducible protein J
MATDAVVRARINGLVKEEATLVLDKMGLSVSDAIRMLMIRIAREKVLPFDVRVPHDEPSRPCGNLRRAAASLSTQ